MKITCIDFETANPFWGSICEIGLAVIEDGRVTFSLNSLIKPHPKYAVFNRDNIRVHGIKPEMVKDAPEFDVIYERIKPYIGGAVLAAHNTTFDISCLRDVLTLYNIPIPGFKYIDTCDIARQLWKGLKNYRLKTVNAYLGYNFKHHDAGEDALACTNIILKAMEQTSADDIHKLAAVLNVKTGEVVEGEAYELTTVRWEKKKADKLNANTITSETKDFDQNHPFLNREIVFTGQFANGMSRREVLQAAANTGARLCNYVRSQTDFLVQGAAEQADTESSKTRKAKKIIDEGGTIHIIGEEEFLKLLANKQ
jgi:DNA polymerase-3 subunit epsilon